MDTSQAFVSDNMNLLGFYDGNAVFQILKELLDNSFDSCRRNFQNDVISGSMQCLILPGKRIDEIILQIMDNGVGIENVQNSIRCFNSIGKNSDLSSRCIGKFGVGLSSSIYYAFKRTNKTIQIKTKQRSEFSTRKYYVIIEDNGLPNSYYYGNDGDEKVSLTMIRIPMLRSSSINKGKLSKIASFNNNLKLKIWFLEVHSFITYAAKMIFAANFPIELGILKFCGCNIKVL
jgi:hypothetical protein